MGLQAKKSELIFLDIVPLKGQIHEMDIFLEGLNILISTFCVFADGF